MKLSIGEIWSFLDLQVEVDGKSRGLNLHAGGLFLENIPLETIKSIQENEEYHSDILEGLFINREILWQPNVYDRIQVCITNLSLFSVFCHEEIDKFAQNETNGGVFYTHLLNYLSELGQGAIGKFSKVLDESKPATGSDEDSIHDPKNKIPRILGNFRKECFPVIRIFVELLPTTDLARISSQHRMDFAVEVIINQYNLKYSDITSPYWEIVKNPGKSTEPKVQAKPEIKAAPVEDKTEAEPSPESQDA